MQCSWTLLKLSLWQDQLASSLGLDANNVTGTMVNEYMNQGAVSNLVSTMSTCMSDAAEAAERAACATVSAKESLVSADQAKCAR